MTSSVQCLWSASSSTRAAPLPLVRSPRPMSASALPSCSTIPSSPLRSSSSRSPVARARSAATSPPRPPTTSPCCCAPAPCRHRSTWSRSAPSTPALAPTRSSTASTAGIVASVLVVVFMVIAYGVWGVFANVSLILNIILIFGALSMLGRHADLARYRRYRADHRHGGRCQRADLRAHARRAGGWQIADSVHQGRFRARLGHHRRLPPDPADLGHRAVFPRLGPGAGLRRDAGAGYPDVAVHLLHGHLLPGGRLVSRASGRRC